MFVTVGPIVFSESILFSIGIFHTNSFLCHPVVCAEVICFATLQYVRYGIVGATWWRWLAPATAAVGVGVGGATPPLATPAAAVGGLGATLPLLPTSAARLCNLRPLGSGLARADGPGMPNGTAALCAEQ